MGILLSCCLKAQYGELSVDGSLKPKRKEKIKSLLTERANPNVDGRRSCTPPPSFRAEREKGGSVRERAKDKDRQKSRDSDPQEDERRAIGNQQLYTGAAPSSPRSPGQVMNSRQKSVEQNKSGNFGTFGST